MNCTEIKYSDGIKALSRVISEMTRDNALMSILIYTGNIVLKKPERAY